MLSESSERTHRQVSQGRHITARLKAENRYCRVQDSQIISSPVETADHVAVQSSLRDSKKMRLLSTRQ